MKVQEAVAAAGRNLKTVMITSVTDDGSMETREAEPYFIRKKGCQEFIFCYDLSYRVAKSFVVSRIISVQETSNVFEPRWTIEF